ncbi:MAG: PD-(D/E)XK nuclease family protein [Patescibacteria group bacterium]
MDLVIKKYFDKFRGKLPPEIEDKVEGKLLPDLELIEKWRNWRTGLEYVDKKLDATLFGALDECLVDDEGYYIPLDYKTKGSAPKDGDSEKYYQTQLDTYAFLLNHNGYKARDFAYLVYYFPKEVKKNGVVEFSVEPIRVSIDLKRAQKTFEDAVLLLQSSIPKTHSSCEYCLWIGNRLEFE